MRGREGGAGEARGVFRGGGVARRGAAWRPCTRSAGHVGPLRPRRPGASYQPPPWPPSGGCVRYAERLESHPAHRVTLGLVGVLGDVLGTRAARRMASIYIMLCLHFVGLRSPHHLPLCVLSPTTVSETLEERGASMGCRQAPPRSALAREPPGPRSREAAAILGGLPDRVLPPGNGPPNAGERLVISLPAPRAAAIVNLEESKTNLER
ncbi:uncharacterized protein LOC116099186 [Mastomys coucha]|uniref:uncharacterized protein LOC116099186 n=1 Tax=Mastomys coucha TaxID=35658 RepID=UPI00126248A0|nr:uncharacterized protein LOC116099186 [Mastomys coucha]